jgi:hypothetical protein
MFKKQNKTFKNNKNRHCEACMAGCGNPEKTAEAVEK